MNNESSLPNAADLNSQAENQYRPEPVETGDDFIEMDYTLSLGLAEDELEAWDR
ncbi:hypothetical protein ACIQTZ_00245 [Paenarthrobacter sp. NPDC090520]|uniref:hypothetical protein n=1 Tax=Paenarthrobacter sp. NPDC090520 TaxID=3364382 RepID=UPI003809E777